VSENARYPVAAGHLRPTALLGSQVVSSEDATHTATMRLMVKHAMITWASGVQGALVAGYRDEVMGCASDTASGSNLAPVKPDLGVSFIRLIAKSPLIGTGQLVRTGQRVIFLDHEVLAPDGVLHTCSISTAMSNPRLTAEQTGMTHSWQEHA
jgi:acyl-coenzyme A thioesterase PaaI-like protein